MPGSCLDTVIRTRISGTPNDMKEYKMKRNRMERGVISLRRGMKYLWKWNGRLLNGRKLGLWL